MVKEFVKSLLARTPYRLIRRDVVNRFQAVEESIRMAAARGYRPDVIVDGGANTGDFAAAMLSLFPSATIHAIEPQPGCSVSLQALAEKSQLRLQVHPVGICSPDDDGNTLRLAASETSNSTGAYILPGEDSSENGEIRVPCNTLDTLIADKLPDGARVMLKLDLQGYELNALKGAELLLQSTDLVLTEVSFFAQAYEPPIAELITFFEKHGFELYDIGSISARPRDSRAKQGDFLFARRHSILTQDTAWS